MRIRSTPFINSLKQSIAMILVVLVFVSPVFAGLSITPSDGIVMTGADCIVMTGADGIVMTGADGFLNAGANGIVMTGADGIVMTGADGIVMTGADGSTYRADSVTVTLPNGIVMTGADGIVMTGADGLLPNALLQTASGLQSVDPELAILLNRLTDDSNVNSAVVYHHLPSDSDLA